MTPYAKAHLRLLQIHRRWRSLQILRKNLNLVAYRFARAEGQRALVMVETDQDDFDYEVHRIDPFDLYKPFD